MAKDQSWIADILEGYRQLNVGGVPVPSPVSRNILNLIGADAVDNPSTGATDVTINTGSLSAQVLFYTPLRASAPTGVQDVRFISGFSASGDGGGGTFIWNPTDTRDDNNATIIQVTGTSTGRWNRVFTGEYNVKWFGATGNGSTDDTAAVQAAINYVIEVKGALYIPTGVYACNALTLNYAQGMSVRGDRSTYNGSTSTGTVIKWTGGSTGTLLTILDAQELDFEHVHFYGQNGGTNAVDQNTFGVNVSSDNAPASYYVTFHRCVFSEFGTCVTWGVNPYQCDKGGIFDSEFWYYTRYGFYVGSANALDQGEIKGCSFVGAPGTTFLPLIATSGTAPPAVSLTGTPAPGDVRIDMNVTTGGPRGTALFTWKLNGVTQQTGQVTAATFALGATGLTLNFPAGTYFTDNVYEAFATNAVGMYFFWCGMMRVTDCVGGGYHKYFAQVNTSLANQIVFTNCESESGPGSWQFYFSGGSDGVTHTLLSNTVTSGVYVGGTSRVLGIANTFLYGGNPPNAGVLLDGSGAKYVGLRDRFTAFNIPTGTTCVINSGIYQNQDLPNASAFGELWTIGQIVWQPPYQDETGNAAEQCVRSGRRAQFWQQNTAYPAGQYIVPTVDNGHVYYTAAGGTSNATTQPTWTTGAGSTQPTDGTIVWIEIGASALFQPFGPLGHFTGTAPPTTGWHTTGEIFWNTAPLPFGGSQVGGANSTYIGWVCTASGAPGTWYPFGGLLSPAPNQLTITSGTLGTLLPFGYTYWLSGTTLSGNVILNLESTGTLGAEWIIDATNVVLSGFTITVKLNGAAWSTTIGTTDIYYLREGGTGGIFGVALTP